jgi:NTE family protein
VALAAGGAKGIAYIPLLRAMEEIGVTPCAIAGSSVGALVGGFYAAGLSPSDMTDILHELRPPTIRKIFQLSLHRGGLISGAGVKDFIRETLPVHRFEDTRIPFRAVATDYWRREAVVFSDGNLVDAIRASTSVPGVFDPAFVGGRLLVDGAAKNTLPYDLIRGECDFIIGLDVSNRTDRPNRTDVPRTFSMVLNTFRVMTDNLTETKLRYDPIDFYYRVRLPDVEMLDFHKYREIFERIAPDVESFKMKLGEALGLG